MNKTTLTLLTLALCATSHTAPKKETTEDRGKTIYTFEHALLPVLTHDEDGAFFKALRAGDLRKTRMLASEFVDADFAGSLKLSTIKGGVAYAITFEEPQTAPHCHHAIIIKRGDAFDYLTLEKGLDLFNTGNKTVLCAWTKEGKHVNLGPRDYTDLKSFATEALQMDGVSK